MHSLPDYIEDLKQELHQKGTKKAAWAIIEQYFGQMEIESIKEELWVLTKGTITNDLMEQSQKGLHRLNLIDNYEILILFVDAVKVLHDKREK